MDCVEGLAVALTTQQVAKLDPFEGYPRAYDHVDVNMVAFEVNSESGLVEARNIAGMAYAKTLPQEVFIFPTSAYMLACCKTIYKYRQLLAKG